MSSMLRKPLMTLALLATPALTASAPLLAQDGAATDRARAGLVATAPTRVEQAIERWERLSANGNDDAGFEAYAGFLLAYPGFPRETLLRVRAENALDEQAVSSERLVAYFEQFPPLTNPARARYALALAAMQRPEAAEVARAAWRGGAMSSPAEAYMIGLFGSRFRPEDHDTRMDALLWKGETEAALRMVNSVSPASRDLFVARLALIGGSLPGESGVTTPADARSDAGYVYNLARHYRENRNLPAAVDLLANRANFASPPRDGEDFVSLALDVAKTAGSRQAAQIAGKVDDLFAPGTDISEGSFVLRDRYTDLMWLGGTKALWTLGDGRTAAPLFYRYGTGAKTPLTRSKGFYWAGQAAAQAGDRADAERYYEMAAAFPDQYYGQLALGELGWRMPAFPALPDVEIMPQQRAAFEADPLVAAIRTMATNRRDWRTERRFFEALADKADTPAEMRMVADLAQQTGLEEMAVVAGMTAGEHGLTGFERLGYPTVPTHAGANWTMVHAIARQESEFDRNRVSHAGARGMMQLMPGTAREEAGKLGIQYLSANLTESPSYNIRLGDAHFARLMERYNGAYPLALAAYNAGPGRVSQWLRLNGDPRNGDIDWPTWIERIPANFETRYYVMRVLGNAVAYANMYPEQSATYQRDIAHYLR